MSTAHFCPGCGRALEAGSNHAFCATCGSALETSPSANADRSVDPVTMPLMPSTPLPAATVSVALGLPGPLQRGRPLREAIEAAAAPIISWGVVSAVIASIVPVAGLTLFSVIGSLLAGLGYHAAASASAGAPIPGLGVNAIAEGTVNAVPVLTLLGLGAAAWWGERRIARRTPASSSRNALQRAVATAAIGAAAIYAIAVVTASGLGDGTGLLEGASSLTGVDIGGITRALTIDTRVSFGPNLVGIIPLFLFLFGGTLAGEGRAAVSLALPDDARGRGWAVFSGVSAYLLITGVLLCLAAVSSVVFLLLNDVNLLVIPLWLAMLPNLTIVTTASFLGAGIDLTAVATADTSDVTRLSVWQDLPLFAWPLAALPAVGAGFLAGAIQQRRAATFDAINSLVATVTLFGVALLMAAFALPSAAGTASADFVGFERAGSLAAALTFGPQLLLGFVLVAGAAILGARFGGRSIAGFAARVGAARDRLAQAGPYWRRRGATGLIEDAKGTVGALSRRTQAALIVGTLGVAVLGVGLTFINSVDYRVKATLSDLAARHPNAGLLYEMGIAGAPADIAFRISDVSIEQVEQPTPDDPSFDVGWTLTAERSGAEVAHSTQRAAFFEDPDSDRFYGTVASGKIALERLMPAERFDSLAEASSYVAAADAVNQDPNTSVSLAKEVEWFASVKTTTLAEPTWLDSEPEESAPGSDGERTTYSYTVGGFTSESVPVYSTVTTEPTPAAVRRGTLQAQALQTSAHDALVALADATTTKDPAAARAVLIGAEGLQLSGLAANDISIVAASDLLVAGTRTDGYFVQMSTPSGDRVIRPVAPMAYDGAWVVDYWGQPLFATEPVTHKISSGQGSVSLTFVASRVAGEDRVTVSTSWAWDDGSSHQEVLKLVPTVDGVTLQNLAYVTLYADESTYVGSFDVIDSPGSIVLSVGIEQQGWPGPTLVDLRLGGVAGEAPDATTGSVKVAGCGANLRSSPDGTHGDTNRLAKVSPGTSVTVTEMTDGSAWEFTECGSKGPTNGTSWYRITSVDGKPVMDLYNVSAVYSATGLFE